MHKIYRGLFLLFLGLFSLGQLQRIQLTPTVGFHIHDLVIFSWVLSTIATHTKEFKAGLRKLFSYKLVILLSCWVIVSLLTNSILNTFSLTPYLYLARLVAYGMFAYSLPFTLSLSSIKQRQLWAYAGLLVGWLGIMQYIFMPDTRFLYLLGWDDHYYRLIGSQFDPGFTGILLIMTIFYTWSLKRWALWLKLLVSSVLGVAVALTFSRATYVSTLLSWPILIRLNPKSVKNALTIVGLVALCFALLYSILPSPGGEGVNLFRQYSISQRLESNRFALHTLAPHQWLIGRGLFVSHKQISRDLPQHAAFPDNLLVFIVASLGIPGLLMSVILIYKVMAYLYKKDKYVLASFTAVLIHSQFNHTLFQPFVLLMLLGGMASLNTERHR